MYLSVIIPAYNEAKRIGATLQSVCGWLAQQPYDSEVIVVNNRSSDGTADVVRSAQHQFRSIRLIDEKRPGKGYAVTAGMLFATGQIRLFMDADSSTTIDHFARMIPHFEAGADVVIASLAAKGSTVLHGGSEPLWRVVMGKMGNLWIQLWAVPGIWDTQRGFKAFTARAANTVFSRMTSFKWAFDIEALAIARAHKYAIREVPIAWNNPPETRVSIWTYPQVLMETVGIGVRKLLGRYRR